MDVRKATKIIATLGPSSAGKTILANMIEGGVDVIRLNFSYGTIEENREDIRMVKDVFEEAGKPGAVLVDTKGPEIRLKSFIGGQAELKQGEEFVLTREEVEGDSYRAAVNMPEIFSDVKPGMKIYLDDGKIELIVNEIKDNGVHCLVKNSGIIRNGKSVNLPGVNLSISVLTEEDKELLVMAAREGVDYIAASFIRGYGDILDVKKVIEVENVNIPVIAKIETRESVEQLEEILEVADGIMIARGDLGVEIQPEDVPLVQKRIIKMARREGKPVVTATQMLESMTNYLSPTRAEASDVANAIFDGTDAVMLSGETAIGNYPVRAVQIMKNIIVRTEAEIFGSDPGSCWNDIIASETPVGENEVVSVTEAIAFSTCKMALQLGTRAILTSTHSGYTARMVAKYRPSTPVLAVTPFEDVFRSLSLYWGVYPLTCENTGKTDDMFAEAVRTAREAGFLKNGDIVILTAGVPVGISGTTNLIRVHTVGSIKVTGDGIGKQATTGRVNIIDDKEKIDKIGEGDIVVVTTTSRDMFTRLSKAAGIVSLEEGLTCNSAIIGLELDLPVILGAKDAFEVLEDGEKITIDPFRGLIYEGEVNIL